MAPPSTRAVVSAIFLVSDWYSEMEIEIDFADVVTSTD